MRYNCPIPTFEECYVDMAERWTRKEVRLFYELRGEEYLQFLATKVVALHLATTGEPITDPLCLTPDQIDEVDIVLWKWFSVATNRSVDDLYSLGEGIALRWLKELEPTTAQADKATRK